MLDHLIVRNPRVDPWARHPLKDNCLRPGYCQMTVTDVAKRRRLEHRGGGALLQLRQKID
jgi:hypothetical protein